MTRFFAILAVALVLRLSHGADLMPAYVNAAWQINTNVGYYGTPPDRTNSVNLVTDYGADPTGVVPIDVAYITAVSALAGLGKDSIYIPAGTYNHTNFLPLVGGYTVYGAGMSNTVLRPSVGMTYAMAAGNTQWYDRRTQPLVTAGAYKGSTNISLADTSTFTVGRPFWMWRFISSNQFEVPIYQNVQGTNDNYGYLGPMLVAMSVTSSNVTFRPPLTFSWTNTTVRVAGLPYGGQAGAILRDLAFDLSAAGVQKALYVTGMRDVLVQRVKVWDHVNYGFHFEENVNVQVEECYIDSGGTGGSNGAGLLVNNTSWSLFVNNIIYDNFPNIEVNHSSMGNAFAYNFCYGTNTVSAISIDVNHAPHNAFNLYEGNIGNNFMSDGYFGSQGPDAFVRNWAHGLNTAPDTNDIGYTMAFKRMSHTNVFLGNVSGTTNKTMAYNGWSEGYPNIGNSSFSGYAPVWANWHTAAGPGGFQELDTNVTFTAVKWGNYDYFTFSVPPAQALGLNTISNSYLYASAPSWWCDDCPWPPVDPVALPARMATNDVLLSTAPITPAQVRYFAISGSTNPPPPVVVTNIPVVIEGRINISGSVRIE
jgi:hypothetical protein